MNSVYTERLHLVELMAYYEDRAMRCAADRIAESIDKLDKNLERIYHE